MNIERRYIAGPARVGVEQRADGKPVIVGYASVFYRQDDAGTEFWLWDDVVERIKPGAFDRAVREDDVRGLFNHDPSEILGRNKAGTLRLSVDEMGLRYEIDPPEWAGKIVESIRRGDVSGSSFGFLPQQTAFREEKRGGKLVTVIEREAVALMDVSPVTFPAYASATTGLRSIDDAAGARAEVERWRAEQAAARRRPRDPILARVRCLDLERRAVAVGME